MTQSIDREIRTAPKEDELVRENDPFTRQISRGLALRRALLKAEEQALSAPTVISIKAMLCAAGAYAEPVIVLVIIIAFLISDLAVRQPGIVSLKTARQIPATTAYDSRKPQSIIPARFHERAGNEAGGTQPSVLEPSHLRVTDPPTFSIVEDLSGPEMRALRRQAKFGDGVAALTLGMAYEIGRHVPQSCTQAADWVATAAIEGNPAAQYNLALRYASGDGTPTNLDNARKWLQKAASHGYQKAKLTSQLANP